MGRLTPVTRRDVDAVHQALGHVAGRGTKNIGQHQHALGRFALLPSDDAGGMASVSSGDTLGCTSSAITLSAQSGKHMQAHCRSAWASGAWAMMRMRVHDVVRGGCIIAAARQTNHA
jgi:hypothetical protein